jgi:protein Mpv17
MNGSFYAVRRIVLTAIAALCFTRANAWTNGAAFRGRVTPSTILRAGNVLDPSTASSSPVLTVFSSSEEEDKNNDHFVTTTVNNFDGGASLSVESLQSKWSEASEFLLPPELMTWKSVGNALILASAFGYALYTILNIDHGMTRGWTQGEIAMRIPVDTWSSYESSLATKPIYTKTLINVIIYHALDFEASRVLKNGLIGLFFGPLVHEYYQFSDRILPPDGGLEIRLQKIIMDQTIYLTVKCSMYISAVGMLNGDNWETISNNVKSRIGNIVFTAWKFWPLVHCITYGVIPARHRILWVNSVDLVWNAILATLARKDNTSDEAAPVEEEVAEDKAVINGEHPQVLHAHAASGTAVPDVNASVERAGHENAISSATPLPFDSNHTATVAPTLV